MSFILPVAVWLLNIAGMIVALAGVGTNQPLLGLLGGFMVGFVATIAAFLLHAELRRH